MRRRVSTVPHNAHGSVQGTDRTLYTWISHFRPSQDSYTGPPTASTGDGVNRGGCRFCQRASAIAAADRTRNPWRWLVSRRHSRMRAAAVVEGGSRGAGSADSARRASSLPTTSDSSSCDFHITSCCTTSTRRIHMKFGSTRTNRNGVSFTEVFAPFRSFTASPAPAPVPLLGLWPRRALRTRWRRHGHASEGGSTRARVDFVVGTHPRSPRRELELASVALHVLLIQPRKIAL